MKTAQILTGLLLVSTLTIANSRVLANTTTEIQGQKIVLLNKATTNRIQAALAKTDLDVAAKTAFIKLLLDRDSKAKHGFCATAVKTLANATKPTAAKVQEACETVFNDPSLLDGIISGDLTTSTEPEMKKLSYREILSLEITGYLTMLAVGPF